MPKRIAGGEKKWDPITGVISALSALSQAIQDNPWSMSIILVAYLNGFALNLYFLQGSVSFLDVFHNLAVGIVWIAFVTVIVLLRISDFLPFKGDAARYILIACLLISSGSVMTLIVLIGISNGVQGFAVEFKDAYGYDLRLVLKAFLSILWFICLLWFFFVATKGARRAIASFRAQIS